MPQALDLHGFHQSVSKHEGVWYVVRILMLTFLRSFGGYGLSRGRWVLGRVNVSNTGQASLLCMKCEKLDSWFVIIDSEEVSESKVVVSNPSQVTATRFRNLAVCGHPSPSLATQRLTGCSAL